MFIYFKFIYNNYNNNKSDTCWKELKYELTSNNFRRIYVLLLIIEKTYNESMYSYILFQATWVMMMMMMMMFVCFIFRNPYFNDST